MQTSQDFKAEHTGEREEESTPHPHTHLIHNNKISHAGNQLEHSGSVESPRG